MSLRRRPRDRAADRRLALTGLERLESRRLLDAAPPHGGGGTLFDEHEAVLRLVDFANIHDVAPGGSTTNYYYVATDTEANIADGTYHWSDVNNWSKEVYDPGSNTFNLTQATQLPGTGDDVLIPAGTSLTYDLGPGSFPMPQPGNVQGPNVSVNTDLRLHSVGVAGSLTFQPNTDLVFYVETMVVTPTGALTITETNPAHTDPAPTARIVIAAPDWSKFSLAQPFDPVLDPLQFGRGLISHGAVNMTGETVTPFITLPSLTRAGNNLPVPAGSPRGTTSPAFVFTAPAGTATTGWSVGDRIVVTGTDPSKVNPYTGASSDEEAVITAVTVNADGSTTFTAQVQVAVTQTTDPNAPPTALKTVGGLQSDHVPPKDPSGQPYTNPDGSAAFGVEIANLSRNIIIQSEDPYHTMARGHTMFMHSDNVNIAGVGFYGLGRTDKRTVVDDPQLYTKDLIDTLNQANPNPATQIPYTMIGQLVPGTGLNPRGRYAVHFHRAGIDETDATDPNDPVLKSTTPAEVQDSVVADSPGWGYVNHTSYVNFDNDVAFNVVGASFVTEAGNEIGRFQGDLAIKGVGAPTGEGIESREVKQDFGFQGDGFWFQGPGIDVENDIAVSQHHDGFVFFTRPLIQNYSWIQPGSDPANPTILTARQGARLTTTIMAQVYAPAVITALGGLGVSVDPGNVPILGFQNNMALADGTGMETWFHQLGATYPRNLGSMIVGLRVANTRGTAMFDPYTNLVTVKDSTLIGNPARPSGVGMDRNSVTANFTYDNDTIRGFGLGIAIPVNGLDIVQGGTYQNKRNFEITTANSQTRTVLLNDKTASDGSTVVSPLTFLPLPTAADETARINVDLRMSYNPKDRDLSKLFNPDIIRMGTVWLNSFALNGGTGPKQLYYYQQNGAFKPFPANDDQGNPINYGGPVYDTFGNLIDYTGIEVPPELLDLTNTQLFAAYGLAIGGTVAPADAQDGMGTYTFTNPGGSPGQASPRINGLIGSLATYQASLDATSARYTTKVDTSADHSSPQYVFSYRYANPASSTGSTSVTLQVGNFIPASGFTPQLTTLTVNGVAVTIPPQPAPPANATATQLKTLMTNYYKTQLKLSLRPGWNLVTGNLDGTNNLRTQLIYGDMTPPELNLTQPDPAQLRRLSTNPANVWGPGTWDQTPQSMTGIWLGSTSTTPVTATVSGQFVGVMNPLDLDFGFDIKGQIVDNSFGHKTFEIFIKNLKSFLNPNDPSGNAVPYLNTVGYTGANPPPSPYANILNYQTFKDTTQTPVYLTQHLMTMFFAIKDTAGNSKVFALTIFLDPTAPRVGGNANPTGNVTPSASMIALASQNGVVYIIDLDTFLKISSTATKPAT
jgi:hypothetical protein